MTICVYVPDEMGCIFTDVVTERARQERLLLEGKFPWSCDNIKIPDIKKLGVLAEEFGEAAKEASQIQEQMDRSYPDENPVVVHDSVSRAVRRRRGKLRAELIQVSAVCVAWCEALDRIEKKLNEWRPDFGMVEVTNDGVRKEIDAKSAYPDLDSLGFSMKEKAEVQTSASGKANNNSTYGKLNSEVNHLVYLPKHHVTCCKCKPDNRTVDILCVELTQRGVIR